MYVSYIEVDTGRYNLYVRSATRFKRRKNKVIWLNKLDIQHQRVGISCTRV